MESLLFEVHPGDPRVLSSAAGILILVGVAAALMPARRAVRIDPMVALRNE